MMISPRVLHCLHPRFALAFNNIIHPLFAPFPCPLQMTNQSSHFRFWTGHSTKAKGRLHCSAVRLCNKQQRLLILFSIFFFSFSASSFANALKAWRGGGGDDDSEHDQQQQQERQQERQQQQHFAKAPPNSHAGAPPSTILSIVCYNCCKKLMGEVALSCVEVCSKNFCTTTCSDAHWSKNKLRCPAPACPRRFFLLKDGVMRGGSAFCCTACADNIEAQ